jgi:putative oxidoreductase
MSAAVLRAVHAVLRLREPVLRLLALPRDLLDLAIRVYVADVFFGSGLSKLESWDKTLFLFQEEYRVPLLPVPVAAFLGTAGEIVFPVLLALGLASRFSAAALFAVNAVAVVSFWHVLGQNEAALSTHVYWGVLLLVALLHGPGRLSVDCLLRRGAAQLAARDPRGV